MPAMHGREEWDLGTCHMSICVRWSKGGGSKLRGLPCVRRWARKLGGCRQGEAESEVATSAMQVLKQRLRTRVADQTRPGTALRVLQPGLFPDALLHCCVPCDVCILPQRTAAGAEDLLLHLW